MHIARKLRPGRQVWDGPGPASDELRRLVLAADVMAVEPDQSVPGMARLALIRGPARVASSLSFR